MTNIELAICEAISTIVDKSIAEAGYDKTIQGKIVSVVDSTIGSYRVSYQDSTFLAYSTSTDVTYTSGSTVYVLIPSGDFSKDKTILGTVKKLGINYVSTTEGQEAYDINGVSVITSSDTFELSSYGGVQATVIYSKDNDSKDNLISIDETAIEQYIKTSENLICGMTVKTSIPSTNQYSGNYGAIFALDFADNATGETITRYYTIDVDKMTGNPYKFINATEQYGIFSIDYENFIEINYISLFCTDFPNESEDPEADIFISDIIMCGATALSSEDLSNYSLTFSTPQGTYFTSSNSDSSTLTLQAQVRVKGKVIDNDSQELPYYWFTEHAGINSQSLYYNKYGGQGWKCINDYVVVDEENNIVEWVAGSYQLTVKKSDIAAAAVTYKCAVVYDGTVITKTIVIQNLGSNYQITIESDSGVQFYYDIGNPTLTCYVNGEKNSNYTYSWSETTYDGTYSSLSNTTELNEQYNELYANYTELLAAIENETVMKTASQSALEEYESSLSDYSTIQRIEDNVIHHLKVSSITTWSTYTCTVYYGALYLGTASIVILNSLETEGDYSLIINNGTYLYKYNESGVSPASDAVENPIDIQSLTFTIYDSLGNAIDDDVASHCSIRWTVPTNNTLITIPNSYTPAEETDDTNVYTNLMSLSYGIASKYDVSSTNNIINLTVVYNDIILSADTNLVFTKEGESGTNGTEYTCRIVPNVASGTAPAFPIITELSGGSWSLNYTPKNANVWFKAQLWHSETRVLESATSADSDEGITATIAWSILKNQYTASVADETALSVIDSDAGTFTYNGYNSTHPADIVKVTIKYNGKYYYATLPVMTVKLSNDDYRVVLKDGTGFQYATYTSDGQSPKYDNSNPFEITVTQNIDDYWEDVSTLTKDYAVNYAWSYLGRIYENAWIADAHLKNATSSSEELERNQMRIKPVSEYDGQCVSNAVECVVTKESGNKEVARIHMPVHLLLNKNGLSSLNEWDGNSVTISEDGGYILAPQIGAGEKDSSGYFTGIVMGSVKESGATSTDIGLFGYSAGARSIFLNAGTGSATFGVSGGGQVIIDPSSGEALIKSGNYSTTNKTGMQINLSEPSINFGSGNFSVTANGYLTAKGGGSIAGFSIDDDSLYTGSKSSSTNVRISSADFQRTVNGTSDSTMRMVFSNNFGVNSSGKMYAASGVIGSGSNKITLGRSSGSTSYSAIYSGSKSSFDANVTNGFYIGTDGIALGAYSDGSSKFQVTSSGVLTAKDGIFSGDITASTITGTTITGSSGYFTEGFEVNIDGQYVMELSNDALNIKLNNGEVGNCSLMMYNKTDGTMATEIVTNGDIIFTIDQGGKGWSTQVSLTRSLGDDVNNNGYTNLATQNWVKNQDYLVNSNLSGYVNTIIKEDDTGKPTYVMRNVTKSGNTLTFYRRSDWDSDIRLKRDITELPDFTDVYMKLQPCKYKFKDELTGHDPYWQFGLIAQPTVEAFKSNDYDLDDHALVWTTNIQDDDEDDFGDGQFCTDGIVYHMDKEQLHALHIQMIQKQQKQIELLEERIERLENGRRE